jgi:hypothetical protein
LTGTPDEIAAGLRPYADASYSQVQVWLNLQTIEGIEAFAPVLELVRGMGDGAQRGRGGTLRSGRRRG